MISAVTRGCNVGAHVPAAALVVRREVGASASGLLGAGPCCPRARACCCLIWRGLRPAQQHLNDRGT